MRSALGVGVLIAVFALAAGLTLPARIQAGALDPAEKTKIIDLLKLQLVLVRGEHGQFHEALEKLVKKYPNDVDVKSLSDEYHQTMHKRMTVQEQTVDLLMSPHLLGGE